MTGDRILLATGDPNGIGPEIALQAAKECEIEQPVVVGDRAVLDLVAEQVGLSLRDYVGRAPETGVVDVVDVGHLPRSQYKPGVVSAEAGAATIAYLTTAMEMALTSGFRAVVAGPHSETAVHAAGIAFRGYPPLVGELTGIPEEHTFLLLIGGGLRIAHVTLHERLADAINRLSADLVTIASTALHETLRVLGVTTPRIGVFGINPHAGEQGLFGSDDEQVTVPAIRTLTRRGLAVEGPLGADVVLADNHCDGYVAMYHDQGHIPVKLLAGHTSCALTIGAGVPFASIGHGPAFDIAGQGTADPTAMIEALRVFRQSQEAVIR